MAGDIFKCLYVSSACYIELEQTQKGQSMSVNVAASNCEHSATSIQHASQTEEYMPMIVAAASAQIVLVFRSANILQHSSEVHLDI